jgi:hypothetical protein
MSRVRGRRGVAGLITVGVFALVLTTFGPTHQAEPGQAPPGEVARPPRPEGKPIALPANLVGLEISLGLKDKERTPWAGEVQVSEGRVLDLGVTRSGPQARAEGNRYTGGSIQPQPNVQPGVWIGPLLHVNLDAPPTATVTVKTRQGDFDFKLADLTSDTPKSFLDGRVTVTKEQGAVRLTGRETEDDYPALARGPDGTIWLAYVEYHPGKPMVLERVRSGDFDQLVPTGNGDQVLLMRFDGKTWYPPLEVSAPGLSAWRPTVTVDGKGVVWVAWSQQVDGDWEIFHRRYTPPTQANAKGQWSDIVRVTQAPGADFHVVATTDSAGTVWLAWQAWRGNNFDILLSAQADGHPWKQPRTISSSKANDWSPAIAADGRGNVYVAWDTYEKGNYDVMLYVAGRESRTIPVADSARFEARPQLACDQQGRVWIAYEQGDEQWGKDYAHAGNVNNVGLEKNLGSALYVRRTVRVKCLMDGRLMEPAGDLEKAFEASKLARNKSLPRLAVDKLGGVWLVVRHHLPPGAAGEVWSSFAFRYDGKTWSTARRLPQSENLLDNRPGLAPFESGIVSVYSGDGRMRTQNRDQDDLFAMILQPTGSTQTPELVPCPPNPPAQVAAVHPHEVEDVARIREARPQGEGKTLHYLRGEFHRHCEYGSHNDQDGLLEDQWRYGLDAGDLDWMGIGDHDYGFGTEYFWWQMQKMTELFQHPPRFIAVHTYERSVVYPNGHRNVIMPKRGIRALPRGELPGTAEQGSPDTKLVYAYLKHFGGICASHTSATGMGTDWRDNDPNVEPVVEIYQGHRHNYEQPGAPRSPTAETQIGGFQPAGFIVNAFQKGYRFGFQASSDHVSTHISYGIVLAEEYSPQGIIDAFRKRHSYAATDNILMDVRAGGHLMGDTFDTSTRPTIEISIQGTVPVAKVHVLRDSKYVYTGEPKQQDVKLRYTDADIPAGKTSYYYVRVEQADGNLAWSSPMWITYKP